MSSEQKKLDDYIHEFGQSLAILHKKTSDVGNMYISMASINSIQDNRTTCNILLLDKNIEILNVRSAIPTTVLNTCGHLKTGDIVLAIYSYPNYTNASIVAKLNQVNKLYTSDKAFEVTNRLNFSIYAI